MGSVFFLFLQSLSLEEDDFSRLNGRGFRKCSMKNAYSDFSLNRVTSVIHGKLTDRLNGFLRSVMCGYNVSCYGCFRYLVVFDVWIWYEYDMTKTCFV